MAELRAANARRVTEFDGPKGQQFHLWMGGARLVLAELWPDGSVHIWRQLAPRGEPNVFKNMRSAKLRCECPLWVCAVKGGAFQWVKGSPGDSLQPEATGAVMEVTKWLKPSV